MKMTIQTLTRHTRLNFRSKIDTHSRTHMAKQKQFVLLRQPLSAARFTQIMEQPATDFHPLPRTHGFGSFRALSLQRSRQLTGRCPGGGGGGGGGGIGSNAAALPNFTR